MKLIPLQEALNITSRLCSLIRRASTVHFTDIPERRLSHLADADKELYEVLINPETIPASDFVTKFINKLSKSTMVGISNVHIEQLTAIERRWMRLLGITFIHCTKDLEKALQDGNLEEYIVNNSTVEHPCNRSVRFTDCPLGNFSIFDKKGEPPHVDRPTIYGPELLSMDVLGREFNARVAYMMAKTKTG